MAVFPEGTTTLGYLVQTFYPALMQSAIDTRQPVICIALSYLDAAGNPSTAAAYVGEDTLAGCLWRIVRSRGLRAVVCHAATVETAESDRRQVCSQAYNAIAWAVTGAAPELDRA
ncbi:MAG: hypothetical protein K9K38_05075 [Rhodoferax sp.]|nr:hypothetical protein [Rhodoferax sp.]